MRDTMLALVVAPWPFRWLPSSAQNAIIALRFRQMTRAMERWNTTTLKATKSMEALAEAMR